MDKLEEGLRHFWLARIHLIRGSMNQGIKQWLLHEKFIFSSVINRGEFMLLVLEADAVQKSLACDITKMASAAFETMVGIDVVTKIPKSTGWILIRAYYAAYFAAHSLLRMFGISCLQLDKPQIDALNHTANGLGMLPSGGFENGLFVGEYGSALNEVHFKKSSAARHGSHQILWKTFGDELRKASNHLLSISSQYNSVALLLSEIEGCLNQPSESGQNWFSHIRNIVNYRQELGSWFPYSDTQASAHELVKIVRKWKEPVDRLISVKKKSVITTHVWLSSIIVAICYAVIRDMEAHCPSGKSFHTYGSMALARMTE